MNLNKILAGALVGAALLVGGQAGAVPIIWTDTVDPSGSDPLIGAPYSYTHNITDGATGYRQGIDSVDSASLKVYLRDDQTGWNGDGSEYVEFKFDGHTNGVSYEVSDSDTFTFGSDIWSWLINQYINTDWLSDGLLNVTLKSDGGDFKFVKSELTVWGDRAASVPEPATLGLFALGLLGVGFAARRKQNG